MKRRYRTLGGSIALSTALAATLMGCEPPHNEGSQAPARIAVPVAVAKGRIDIEGGVIQVAAPRDGVIAEVMVQEGARVRKGQLLAKQDGRAAELALREAEASMATTIERVHLIDTQLSAARRELARVERLAEAGAEMLRTRDEAQDRVHQLTAELRVARAEVSVARARTNVARLEVEQREIRSPIDGIILRRSAHPGTGASTLNVTSLFAIAPQTARIVRVELEESFIGQVQLGQPVEIVSEVDPAQTSAGHVVRRGQIFGMKRGGVDDPNEKVDERVVEVVTSLESQSFLIGQRVRVNFRGRS